MPRPPEPPPRRLMISHSAGDLLSLAKSSAKKSLEPKLNKKDKHIKKHEEVIRSGIRTQYATLPDPEASVVCGELYRLSLFGVWCRLWLELRLSYLLFFYDSADSLPIDVVHLRGYSVHKAPECDHLEGLYPMKIACQDDGKIVFFCAENEECRVKWMAALWRACSTKRSLIIEGLNLAPEVNESRKNSEISMDVNELEDDTLSDLRLTNSVFYLSEDSECKKATAICNVYDRIEELTEHEVLRSSTYWMQRRLSTQIKMQTLQDELEGGCGIQRVEKKLHDLEDRLHVIESCKEETERAAEQKLHQVRTKKADYLRQLSQSSISLPTASSDEESKEPAITIIVQTASANAEVVLRKDKKKRITKATAVERHKTFSPGDWKVVGSSTPPSLRKVGSLDDMSETNKGKRRGPLRLLSHVRSKKPSTTDGEVVPKSNSHRRRLFFRSASHNDAVPDLNTATSGEDANEVFEAENVVSSALEDECSHSDSHKRHTNLRSTIKRIFSFKSGRHHSTPN